MYPSIATGVTLCAIPIIKSIFKQSCYDLKRINQVSGQMTSKLLSRSLRVFSLLLIIVAVAALMVSMLLKDLDYYTRMGPAEL